MEIEIKNTITNSSNSLVLIRLDKFKKRTNQLQNLTLKFCVSNQQKKSSPPQNSIGFKAIQLYQTKYDNN